MSLSGTTDRRTSTDLASSSPTGSRVRQLVRGVREDRLYRTSVLLVVDSVMIGALGGVFILVAAHVWEPRTIGVVAAIMGASTLLVTAAGLGMPSTVVAFLAGEPDQALMMRGALLITIPVGAVLLAGLWVLPGHATVPLVHVGVSVPWAVLFTFGLVASNIVVAVGDPAFLARQEVSWIVGKDMAAMAVRFLALVLLIGTGTAGYFGVAVIYTGFAALVDLGLLRWRLRRAPRPSRTSGVKLVRTHAGFAAGNQIAVLVAMIPTALLPVIVLARLGAASAAYIAVAMQILAVLTVLPSMTSQSLFAEMSAHPDAVLEPVRKALRAAYVFTIPAAVGIIVGAPALLELFGPRYSIHGRDMLRWGAASSIFFCLNYVSDIVLLARRQVTAYVIVNVVGTIAVLLSIFLAVGHGLDALGVGWFIGQGCYCAVSCAVVAWYVGRKNLAPLVRYVLG